ncbi:MAG: hypothetical protein ABJL67_11885 [Sulfitobacter sp.]
MQDKTIDGALLELRKRIIRGKLDGLAQVETLLVLRGVHMPRVLPAKRKDIAGKGVMAHLALKALQNGPQPAINVSKCIALQRPELPFHRAHQYSAYALTKLKKRGLVVHDGRKCGLWSLA